MKHGANAELNSAEFTIQFPNVKDRQISATFLEDLLTGALPDFKPHRNGVRILGAIIDEPVDLTNAQIPCEVWLRHCQFNSNVHFLRTRFAGPISFDYSTFKSDADFTSMRAESLATFSNVVFEGAVNFIGADIAVQLIALNTQFRNAEKPANFNGLKAQNALFSKAVFEGPVDFRSANIVGQLHANEAQFKNKEHPARFGLMKVEGATFFQKTIFEGPVDFDGADIATLFHARDVEFRSKTKAVTLSMRCGGLAILRTRRSRALFRFRIPVFLTWLWPTRSQTLGLFRNSTCRAVRSSATFAWDRSLSES